MTKEERRIYQLGVAVCAVLAVAIFTVFLDECQSSNLAVYATAEVEGGYFTDQTSREPETGLFDANSAMPCVDSEAFRSWYQTYQEEDNESQTSEEARTDGCREDHEADREDTEPEPVSEEAETEVETAVSTLYRISGKTIDEGIQVLLHHHLEENGIGWMFELSLCQIFQESGGNRWAENKNGLDKGILQYRTTYWTEPESIFDVEAQIRKYSQEMAARFNSGLSTDEAISRHNTSDYISSVNWEYVAQVRQWIPLMEEIR